MGGEIQARSTPTYLELITLSQTSVHYNVNKGNMSRHQQSNQYFQYRRFQTLPFIKRILEKFINFHKILVPSERTKREVCTSATAMWYGAMWYGAMCYGAMCYGDMCWWWLIVILYLIVIFSLTLTSSPHTVIWRLARSQIFPVMWCANITLQNVSRRKRKKYGISINRGRVNKELSILFPSFKIV